MKHNVTPPLLLLVSACAGATFHGRMAEAAAPRLTEYECQPTVTAEAVGRASENFMTRPSAVAVPQPGEDVCEVLLAVGLPSETDRLATADARSQSLWYREGAAMHLVRVTFDQSRTGRLGSHWLVDAVNW